MMSNIFLGRAQNIPGGEKPPCAPTSYGPVHDPPERKSGY